jgi:large repetitive protein
LLACILPALILFSQAQPAHATVTPTTPTTGGWTVLPYPPGTQSDYVLDQQTGSEEGDIVGESGSGDLSGAYIAFNPGTTPTNGFFGFRVRVGADVSPPGYKSEMHVGIDANGDGRLDVFLSVDNSGVGSFLRIFAAGNGQNISPSTTTISNTPLFTYSEVASNYDFEAVTATIDPRILSSTNSNPLDLDRQGNNDYFLSFFFPFSDVVSALKTVGVTNTITTNTLFRFVVASSTQPNSLNQDINGLNGGVNSTNSYTNTTGITPPVSIDGQTNRAPVVANDTSTTPEDTQLLIPVLANDSDPDGDTISIGSVSTTNGTVSISGTNVVFTPAANFNGTVVINYTAIDGHGGSTPGTITVTVAPVNDAPTVANDSYSVSEDTTLAVSAPGVLSNDSDVDGDSLTANLVSTTSNGTLTFNSNGSFTYKPNTDFNGTDSFTYTANDGSLNGNTATVTITVNPVNDAPIANNDSYAVFEDTVLTVSAPGVLANDTDIDSATLTASVVSNPTHGSLTLNSDGSFTYTPSAGYVGADSFTYRANDGSLNSGTATVDINVKQGNRAPIANGDSYSVNEDITLNISAPGVLANDADPDGDVISAVVVSNPSHGSLTLSGNGSFVYTPNANYNGGDSFTYYATDGLSNSLPATVSITVNSVNDAPVAVNDTYSVNEDNTLTVSAPGVLGNDTDVDSGTLTATVLTGPNHGTLTLNSDGSFTYVPNTNYNGSDSFTYEANDGQTNSATATVNITVNSVNDVPVAVADNYSVNEDGTLTVSGPGVLGNDTDADGDPITAILVSGPTHGSLTLNPDGSFTYTPDPNYHGGDSFTYKPNDGTADGTPVTVNLTVNSVNDAPVASDDNYSVNEDTALVISAPGVLANDSDVDGDTLTAVVVASPTHGTLTLNGDGSFTYTPNANYNGSDSFTYKPNDGTTDGNTATVNITVNSVNDAPVANDDNYSVNEDSTLTIAAPGVLGNDTDVDGDTLTASVVAGPAHGSLTLNSDGSFSYTPNADYNGPDSFTYKANDGTTSGNTATVNITVNSVNDAPVAADDNYTVNEDTTLTIAAPGVLANDSDVDSTNLTSAVVVGPTHGSLTLNTDGSFSYTPNANYNGSDSFTYQASDSQTNSSTATVNITVNPVNDAPVGVNDSYNVNEDTTLNVTAPGVLGNDSDVDGDALTAILASGPVNGTLTLNSDGSFSYTPNANYNGSDNFTYKPNDGTVDGTPVTVTITVNSVNDAPVAVNDSYTANEDTALLISAPGVLGNDTDVDGDTLTAVVVNNPTHGTLTLNSDGSFTYTPDANYNGSDSFTYKPNDGTTDGNTATVNITVNSVNDAPVATNDSYSVNEDTTLTVAAPGVLGNDSDVDGDTLTAILVAGPTHGTLNLSANGSFTYTPATNYNGPDSFTYKPNDGTTDGNTATVNITVDPVNDAPVASNDSYTTAEDTVLNIAAPGVLTNDSDVDGNSLTAVLVANPTHGTVSLNSDGSFTYTPSTNYNGADSFTYKANDGAVDGNVATVNITVTALNDPPVAVNDSYIAIEDSVLNVPVESGVLANDTDVDDATLTASVVSGPSHGSLTLNADGSFTYTPTPLYAGPDGFVYQAVDSATNTATATVNITVRAINHAPAASNDTYNVNEDTALNIAAPGVLGNDTDSDGDTLEALIVTGPTNGTLTLNLDGSFLYTPNTNYNGIDTFTYNATDGIASNTATVTITVNAVNDAPVANNDSYSVNEDTTLTIAAPGVLGNDTDVEGDSLTATVVGNPAHGSLTLNSDGSFSYTPSLNYNGPDSFTYKVNDGTVDGNTATVSITVNAVNDAPVSVNDSYTVNEDTTLNISAPGVLSNDSDVDGNSLTAIVVAQPTHGTLTLNSDGSFGYVPNANYNGPDSFTYKANDGTVDGNTATVDITVTAVNDAPVAVDDSYSVNEDTTLTIAAPGVLANDTDVDNTNLTASVVAAPTHGSLTLNSDGSFTYTPTNNYNGPDSFTYQASDAQTNSSTATVSITVNPVNDAPVANNDSYSVNEDTVLNIAAPGVLNNDSDVENDTLSAIIVSNPAHGTVTLNPDGSFSYTPNTNYNGADSFTYKANDGSADSSVATVSITVNAVNDAPVANNDSYSVNEDTTLNISAPGVLGNDSDVDGDTITATVVTGPTHGSLTLNGDGSFTYTPNANYNGPDSFTYKPNDGTADGNVATVSITVNAVNDAPVANNDSYTVNEDTTLTIAAPGVLGNDTDVDGDLLTAILVVGPTNGTLTLSSDGSFVYTPTNNYNGADSFTYKANDGQADSAVATVSITVNAVNDAPVAVNDSYSVNEDTTLTIAAPGVLANDTDVDSTNLTASVVVGPTHGSLTLNSDGSFTYTPTNNYNGPDSFTYQAADAQTNSSTATVSITVNPVNDAPVANNDSYSVNEDTALNISAPGILTNDTDVENDTLSAIIVSNPAHGIVTLNPDGSFSYTPSTNYNGPDSFTYKANDGSADSGVATVSITVNAVNDAPVANNDNYSVNEDTTLTVSAPGVLGNDTDVDGDSLTSSVVSGPTHGSLTLNGDGSFSYTPDANYNGPDSFTYQASDGTLTGSATVNITVNPINDPPVAVNDSYTMLGDSVLNVSAPGVLGNDSDIDSATITAVLISNPLHGSLTLNPDGSFTYTPTALYNGPDSFTYQASDGLLNSTTATVNITVKAINHGPVANNDSYSTAEDTALTISAPGVLNNDTDSDGDTLTTSIATNPSHGSVTLNANGSFTYTPAANYNGPDSFTYIANDGLSNSAPATVSINVTAVNDAPVANDDDYTVNEDQQLTVSVPGVLANDTDVENDTLTAVIVANPTNGVITLNPDGSFVYTPNTNYNGIDTFTYKANDGTTSGNIGKVTITINAVNDAPVAVDDTYSVNEDATLTITAPGVLVNDSDVDSTNLTSSLVAGPTHGTLNLNPDGSFTYTPSANYNGPDSFTYQATDSQTNSTTATVNITVTPVNDAPVAQNDSYTTAEDTSLVVSAPGVLGNDSDIDGDGLTAIIVANPAHGTLTLNANGSFTYTPNANYNGPDSFTYKANDGTADSGVATVSVTVTAVNDAPIANNDSYTTAEDTALVVAAPGVLGNDTDVDGDTLLATLVTGPTHGTLTLSTNGGFTYTPNANYNGPDSFTYEANDSALNSSTATVNITVTPVNDAPVANNDSYTTAEDTALVITAPGVLANDTDVDGDALNVASFTNPAHGTLTLNANGSFTYTPNANYNGLDSFTYVAADAALNSSAATVTITVTPVNDAPVAANDNYSVMANATLNVAAPGLLSNDTDIDGNPLQVSSVVGPTHGTLTGIHPDGSFTYVPNANYVGTDTFTYTANDGTVDSAPATVTITVIPNPTPVLLISAGTPTFNTQSGLYEQKVTVTNAGTVSVPALRVIVSSLSTNASVYNATGTSNGVPYVHYNAPLDIAQSVTLTLKYYVPNRKSFSEVLTAIADSLTTSGTNAATGVLITRGFVDNRSGTPRFVIEFPSIIGRTYVISYCDDTSSGIWKMATPSIVAGSNKTQWYDDGAPETDSAPLSNQMRLYRATLVPTTP